jgi:lysozyme
MMRLSLPARERLKRLEGFRAKAYIPVPGDRATIGYGFTDGVKLGDRMTREEADARLVEELRPYEMAVWQGCTLEPNQNEFDAMVLLCFNIGPAGFKKSTVLKAHNRGDHQAAARAFGLWNKSGGKVYAGLTKRRAEESALYLTPMPDDVSDPPEGPIAEMPQTVDAESRMTESPINRAGVVAGGTAAVATVAETARTVAEVKYSVSSLGDWLVPLLLVVVVVLCGYMVWQRWRQRSQGWA